MKVVDFGSTSLMNISGSALCGYVTATYAQLVEVFGEPHYGPNVPGEKVTCQWELEAILETGEKVYFTIYDWKVSETPIQKYSWHIGGFDQEAVEAVHQILARSK